MKTTDQLNCAFGKNRGISFRELPGGNVIAEIDNAHATASVSLYGGHIFDVHGMICTVETFAALK